MVVRDKDLLESAKSGPLRKGRRWLIKYLEGGTISRAQGVEAKCYDCLGMGDQGDCDQESCPLYDFSPFKSEGMAESEGLSTKEGIESVGSVI